MGYKKVCLNCRKAFNTSSSRADIPEKCNECGQENVFYYHLFQPPPKNDIKAWKVVAFLHEHGFTYHHVWKNKSESSLGYEGYADYPTTMEEAKIFVERYKSQAYLPKRFDK